MPKFQVPDHMLNGEYIAKCGNKLLHPEFEWDHRDEVSVLHFRNERTRGNYYLHVGYKSEDRYKLHAEYIDLEDPMVVHVELEHSYFGKIFEARVDWNKNLKHFWLQIESLVKDNIDLIILMNINLNIGKDILSNVRDENGLVNFGKLQSVIVTKYAFIGREDENENLPTRHICKLFEEFTSESTVVDMKKFLNIPVTDWEKLSIQERVEFGRLARKFTNIFTEKEN